jgi:ATP-binding cassette, subfamily B, bacterial
MWRALKLGYQAEPLLMSVAFGLSAAGRPARRADRLWLKFLADGLLGERPGLVMVAAVGLGVSAAATWFLRVSATARSAASAIRSRSRSNPTWRSCRRR